MDAVAQIISNTLKDRGFKKKGTSLYRREVGDIVNVIYDTKSRFNGQHYLDIGLIHPEAKLNNPNAPIGWHVNNRLELVRQEGELMQALNSDEEMSDNVRIAVITRALDYIDEVLFNRITTRQELEDFAMLSAKDQKPWLVPPNLENYVLEKRGLPVPNYD
jgi:hypothetical protein